MIKLRNSFVSANDVEVILTLQKTLKKEHYDVFYTVVGIDEETTRKRYLTEVGKVGCNWIVTDVNLDSYEKDYQDVKFNKLSELIKYIGITEIENGEWYNLY